MASLGTPPRGPAPPPPFVRCLARSLQARSVQPRQAAAGATCCIPAENSPGARRGTARGARTELFVCSPTRRAGFPGTDSPRRADSPAAGRREPFQELLGRGLAAAAPAGGSAPAARASSLGPAPRARPPGSSRGRSRGARAASGRDPSRRAANQPGGNSFFPHSAPRGCRQGKRRRRRKDRARQGEGEALRGSASGQPAPGTPSEKSRD